MGRWEPDGRARLRAAALELYLEKGFEQTTVTEIAARAGLTERTFFRYFDDKREVLFDGTNTLADAVVDAIAAADSDTSARRLVLAGVHAAATVFPDERRMSARRRQDAIDANPALHERELLKMARLSRSARDAFLGRGLTEPLASVAAQATVAVFGVAFERWIRDPGDRSFDAHVDEAMSALDGIVDDR
jgi:AcrR family transcriptional regulator